MNTTHPALVANTDMGWGYGGYVDGAKLLNENGGAWSSASASDDGGKAYNINFTSAGWLNPSGGGWRRWGYPIRYITLYYITTHPALVANTDMGWEYGGGIWDITLHYYGTYGYGWSSTSSNPTQGYVLAFSSDGRLSPDGPYTRNGAAPIRSQRMGKP